MSLLPILVRELGPELSERDPARGFGSIGEEIVYWELVRRIGRSSFRYQFSYGDIPYTPAREERSVDFLIPSLDLALMINAAFTHPNPTADLYT